MIDFLSRVDDLGLWLAAVVAGLAALGTAIRWIVRRTRRAWKALKPWIRRAQIVLEAAEVELRLEEHLVLADAAPAEIYARLGGIEETNDEQAAAIAHLADTLPRMAE